MWIYIRFLLYTSCHSLRIQHSLLKQLNVLKVSVAEKLWRATSAFLPKPWLSAFLTCQVTFMTNYVRKPNVSPQTLQTVPSSQYMSVVVMTIWGDRGVAHSNFNAWPDCCSGDISPAVWCHKECQFAMEKVCWNSNRWSAISDKEEKWTGGTRYKKKTTGRGWCRGGHCSALHYPSAGPLQHMLEIWQCDCDIVTKHWQLCMHRAKPAEGSNGLS